MTRDEKIDLATFAVALIAIGVVLTGIWWCWPPAALIVAGAVLLGIVGNFHNKRKKQ